MATRPHVHKRNSAGEAACGRGGPQPRLTAYTDEVTCTYCAQRVKGIPGASYRPVPRWYDDWALTGRDRDGNLILIHKPTGGLYRVIPEEDL